MIWNWFGLGIWCGLGFGKDLNFFGICKGFYLEKGLARDRDILGFWIGVEWKWGGID